MKGNLLRVLPRLHTLVEERVLGRGGFPLSLPFMSEAKPDKQRDNRINRYRFICFQSALMQRLAGLGPHLFD
jgi:hypothetical protein